MKNGFTLLEMLVVVLIVGILAAVAVPYYFNAVESARMTEVVVLWGRQKNFVTGKFMSQEQADRMTQRLQKANLKKYTGQVICRPTGDANNPCWEALFTQTDANPHAAYQLSTTDNFASLACIPLNGAGKNFCQTQANDDAPITLDGKEAYLIR